MRWECLLGLVRLKPGYRRSGSLLDFVRNALAAGTTLEADCSSFRGRDTRKTSEAEVRRERVTGRNLGGETRVREPGVESAIALPQTRMEG